MISNIRISYVIRTVSSMIETRTIKCEGHPLKTTLEETALLWASLSEDESLRGVLFLSGEFHSPLSLPLKLLVRRTIALTLS